MRLQWLAGLILLIGVLIYLPGLSGPLLFDDVPALTGNHLVQIKGEVFDEWRAAALSSSSGPLRRPIAMLSFAANHAISGDFSSFGLKVVNLGIHLAVAILLYFLCLSILDAPALSSATSHHHLVALTAAAIWLLHPLNVSTVLYVVQRMAQLSALFVLAGLLLFMHYRRRWAQVGAKAGEVLAGMLWLLLLTLGATLSKENGALLPWLIVVLELCLFRGVWAGQPVRWLRRAGWIALLLPVGLVVVVLAFAPDSLVGGYARREFTLEERLLTQTRLLWRYLGWIVIPNINDMGFQHDGIALSTGLFAPRTTFVALLAWAVTLVVAFFLRKRFPLLLLAVLFYLVGHSMESTVLPLEMVYEHRNYLPGTLVCLCLAYSVVVPMANNPRLRIGYPVGGILVIFCLLLFVRVQNWSDEMRLASSNLVNHPDSSRSNYFYANALLHQYRRSEEQGLSDSERADSLLLSRHYFERMHQANDRDLAALVLLYYLDSRYYTQMQDNVDWLSEIDELLESRIIQASDWNALGLLFTLFSEEADQTDSSRMTGLLDKLVRRYPGSANVLRYRYLYFSATGSDPSQLVSILERGEDFALGNSWYYRSVIHEMSRVPDVPGMYRYARLWLVNDSNRYHLHELKALFALSDASPEAASD